jgi:hypothetical protein
VRWNLARPSTAPTTATAPSTSLEDSHDRAQRAA